MSSERGSNSITPRTSTWMVVPSRPTFRRLPARFQRTFKGGDGTGWCFSSDLFVTKIAFGDEDGQAKPPSGALPARPKPSSRGCGLVSVCLADREVIGARMGGGGVSLPILD